MSRPVPTNSALLDQIGTAITNGCMSGLSRLDILPTAAGKTDVALTFRGAGQISSGGLVVFFETFDCDDDAIGVALEVFSLLVARGLARPSDAASWRRGMIVAV